MTVTTTELSLEQQNAVELCTDLTERIVSVTGGAGTGKTLVLGHVYRELCDSHSIVLCAPTGRAAKRIQELTGIAAKTIHRLLEFPTPEELEDGTLTPGEPKRGAHFRLEERVVIVDEASMLAPTLFRQLMNALPANGVIRFFGDNNQLPPVEDGPPPFVTMLEQKPAVTLTFNYRSDDAIVSNALRVLDGRVPLRNDRFEIVYTADPIAQLLSLIKDEPRFMTETHQVIMPAKTGKYGTQRANPSLQLLFNRDGAMLRLDRLNDKEAALSVRARDKVLWIKNDYQLNLFNGEIGFIEWLDEHDGAMSLVMNERTVQVPPRLKTYNPYIGSVINYDPRKQLELGYAITTHKAQGSEFDHVVYCMDSASPFLLGRRNFYTGLTRARSRLTIVCDRRAMSLALRRNGR